MEIHYARADELYYQLYRKDNYSRKKPFPPDKMLPRRLSFDLKDFDSDYVFTPLDELFRFAANKLGLSFKSADFNLQRSLEFPPPFGAPDLIFKAYKNKTDCLLGVEYHRKIHPERRVFDGIDTGEMSLEKVIDLIKTSKSRGGIVNINLEGLSLSLEHKNKSENTESYTLSLYLKEPNLPWLTPYIPVKVEKKFEGEDSKKAVEFAETILTSYLSYQ